MAEDKNKSRKDLTNVQNTSIIENNGTTTKKVGRPQNSELSNVKLALQAKKRLDKKSKKVKKLTRSLARVQKEVASEVKSFEINPTENNTTLKNSWKGFNFQKCQEKPHIKIL